MIVTWYQRWDEAVFRPPEHLSFEGNLAENWHRWQQRFKVYLTASGVDTKSDAVKSATFLHMAGPEVLEVFNTLTFDNEGDGNKLDKLTKKFQEYCTPKKNITWKRHVFNMRPQQPGESINQYVTNLKKKAKSCEFSVLKDSLIKDRMVYGIVSDKTRARLLKQADITLQKAKYTCRGDEIALNHMQSMGTSKTTELAKVELKKELMSLTANTKNHQHQHVDTIEANMVTNRGGQLVELLATTVDVATTKPEFAT